MNYWQALLVEQKKRGRKGFTIPFIIGSQNYLPDNYSKQGIKELILEVSNSSLFETCIRYCMDTDDLILEIRNPRIPVVYPVLKELPQSALSISIANNDLGDSVELVILTFIERYQKFIDAEQFSKHADGRGHYTPAEVKFIKKPFQIFNK